MKHLKCSPVARMALMVFCVFALIACKGPRGSKGLPGVNGANGINGGPGAPGESGKRGQAGSPGKDGKDAPAQIGGETHGGEGFYARALNLKRVLDMDMEKIEQFFTAAEAHHHDLRSELRMYWKGLEWAWRHQKVGDAQAMFALNRFFRDSGETNIFDVIEDFEFDVKMPSVPGTPEAAGDTSDSKGCKNFLGESATMSAKLGEIEEKICVDVGILGLENEGMDGIVALVSHEFFHGLSDLNTSGWDFNKLDPRQKALLNREEELAYALHSFILGHLDLFHMGRVLAEINENPNDLVVDSAKVDWSKPIIIEVDYSHLSNEISKDASVKELRMQASRMQSLKGTLDYAFDKYRSEGQEHSLDVNEVNPESKSLRRTYRVEANEINQKGMVRRFNVSPALFDENNQLLKDQRVDELKAKSKITIRVMQDGKELAVGSPSMVTYNYALVQGIEVMHINFEVMFE